ncbi:MAG: hypothetical protein OXU36_15065 [Candidatus Poribacteria bacterium]|nr:hypothetical protein [Candidatus Poribacteria bacterium]
MKTILAIWILFSAIALPALGELTDADLDKIRLIVNEGVKQESAASEARMKEYIDLKLANVNNQIKTNNREIGAIRSQINVFIGIPLLIITLLFAWRALRDRANDKQIQALIAENEDLKRQQTITS